MMIYRGFMLLALIGGLVGYQPAEAQFQIRHSVLGNGGATVENGVYRLAGTVGQPAIGQTSGGNFRHSAGFWYLTDSDTMSTWELVLEKGWNLISIPGEVDGNASDFLTGNLFDNLWEWLEDEADWNEEPPEELRVGHAYWIRSDAQITIDVPIRAFKATYAKTLPADKWATLGGVNKDSVGIPDAIAGVEDFWAWNALAQAWVEDIPAAIERGQGYWIKVEESTTINVGSGRTPPPTPAAPPMLPPMKSLPLSVKTSDGKVISLKLGLGDAATSSADLRTFTKLSPPPLPSVDEKNFEAYLTHNKTAQRFRRSARKIGDSVNWTLNLSIPPSGATLRWEPVTIDGYEVVLHADEQVINTNASQEFRLVPGQHRYLIEMRRPAPPTPKATTLLQNYPNPFNPETWIPYQLSESANVSLKIYTSTGELVRQIHLGERPAGSYVAADKAIHWDGRNSAGEIVSSGVYFYVFTAADYQATRRMLILK